MHLDSFRFPGSRLFTPQPGLRLPLKKVNFLACREIRYMPLEEGVWAQTAGKIALYSHDLTRTLWSRRIKTRVGMVIRLEDTLLAGPDDAGVVREFSIADGALVRRVEGIGGLRAGRTASTFVHRVVQGDVATFKAFDRDTWEPLWERPGFGEATSVGESYVLSDDNGRMLHRVDARTGKLAWSFAIPTRNARASRPGGLRIDQPRIKGAGLPSVVDVGTRLIVVLQDSTVLAVDSRDGRLLRSAVPPHPGNQLVTKKSIFFLQHASLSEFDHRSFEEVGRLDYRAEVMPLYGGRTPSPLALTLTAESLIWNDASGMILGVSRKAQRGRRTVWHDHPPGVFTSIAEFPMAEGHYLYRAVSGTRPGLQVYKSVEA